MTASELSDCRLDGAARHSSVSGIRQLTTGIAGDQVLTGLLGRGAREVCVGPHYPVANALMRGKPGIRVGNRARGSVGAVVENENRTWFRVSAPLYTDHHAVSDRGLRAQSRFQVFWIDVHAFAGDDDIFLAALKVKIAGFVQLSQIASSKPFPVAGGNRLSVDPVGFCDAVATNEYLAGFVELNVASGQGLADR